MDCTHNECSHHSLSVYPSDPLNALGFDGNIITLVGNDPNTCQPMALPATAFARTDVRAKTIDEIRGAAGFAAAPAVLCQGPHAAGTADTDGLLVWPVMLIPVDAIPDIMTNLPAGFYTFTMMPPSGLIPQWTTSTTLSMLVHRLPLQATRWIPPLLSLHW